MNRVVPSLLLAVIVVAGVSACAHGKRPDLRPTAAEPGASLWVQPADLSRRDLLYGPWGRDAAPNPQITYTFVEQKHTGVNPGMTVRDSEGRVWSVKQAHPGELDPEGPVEVALSRLLSGVGYHQPPVYYLPTMRLKNDWGLHVVSGGRLRPKMEGLKDTGAWKWEENPFIGTRPYQGLLVMLMMFNATDLKNSNNSLYEHKTGEGVERWYAVRDLGAALGDTNKWAPRKNNADAFERQPFVLGVENGFVQFAYNSWYKNFVRDRIKADDVVWASNLLSQLSDRQWHDAFRAGGYQPAEAERFIRKIREKVKQGQALRRG